MAQRTIQNLDELRKMVGQEVGVSEWHPVTQEAINMFADATLDHQWIHVDPERARRESPFRGPDRPRVLHPEPRALFDGQHHGSQRDENGGELRAEQTPVHFPGSHSFKGEDAGHAGRDRRDQGGSSGDFQPAVRGRRKRKTFLRGGSDLQILRVKLSREGASRESARR